MEINSKLSDEAVLEELGQRLQQRRLDFRLTQAELAERAGVGKRTVERLENGASVQLLSLMRVLRVLNLLGALDELLPGMEPRPMDLLRLGGKRRQRAGTARREGDDANAWHWGEE